VTVTAQPTWRPFHDEPLFTADLLYGVDDMPDDVRDTLIAYIEQVAARRRAPLHVTTAFNALHFGFDLETGGYRAAVLDPELFVRLTPGDPTHPALPVGTFVRLERGRQSLWAEVVARFGAHPGIDDDGWVPPALSGAPLCAPAPDDQAPDDQVERVVLDPEAFGSPLSAGERAELNRLRRRGVLLDDRGHLTCSVRYPEHGSVFGDDTALYAQHLLTEARPLLVGGPLGGLLTDPDDEVLELALHTALETVDKLLTRTPGLHRWGAYATPVERYRRRRHSRELLGGRDLDELTHATTRATTSLRFSGVWPLLAERVEAARDHDPDEFDIDPLELTAAAEAVVHANLALADVATSAVDGVLPSGVHLRVDDLWQAGGVWRAQRAPVPADVLEVDPLRPLGLGYRQAGHEETRGQQEPSLDAEPMADDASTDRTKELVGGGRVDDGQGPEPKSEPQAETEPEPEPEPEPDGDGEGVIVEHLDDSIAVYTVALREAYLDDDVLPLPEDLGTLLADGPLVVELHHDGGQLLDAERVQHAERDGGKLIGIEWPLTFYVGIKVTVALARGARRLLATTTLLAEPLPFGEEFRWAADVNLLAASLGLPVAADAPQPDDDAGQVFDDGAHTVPSRYRGIDPLRRLIIAAFRRQGVQGAFGARRLTGPQLLAALFGDDLGNPALLWQVIYTCERLVDAGKLTREPNPTHPDRPGSGGPDMFVWWPNETARQQSERQDRASRQALLKGKVRDYWVPPFCRLLPDGYQASDQARQAYASYIRALRSPGADTKLPAGYTFVRGHAHGSDPGPIWTRLTSGCPDPPAPSMS
jgi:hypothetical protein